MIDEVKIEQYSTGGKNNGFSTFPIDSKIDGFWVICTSVGSKITFVWEVYRKSQEKNKLNTEFSSTSVG